MIVIVLALIAVNVASVASFGALLRTQSRAHARREDLLVNQLMHLAGKAWTPPPAETWTAPAAGEPLVRDWTPSPEQQPLYT